MCKDLPEIETSEQALGALYVMEGSTLGGTILTKLVTEKMQFDSCDGVRFFSGYGEQTMAKWQIFKEHLNNYSSEKPVHDQVVRAANETFIKFRNWIETH